jgi:hypothetical protein
MFTRPNRNLDMKKLQLITLFICVTLAAFAQTNTSTGNTIVTFECIEIDQGTYFSNEDKGFKDYQTLYINKENGVFVVMNGESFGVPQYSKNDILIFGSNKLPANYSLEIISDNQTTVLSLGNTSSISTNKTNTHIALFNENNIEISRITIK